MTEKINLTGISPSAKERLLFVLATLVLFSHYLLGCTTTTSHENFVRSLNLHVGRVPNFAAHIKRDMVRAVLPSGNIEYRYAMRWHGRGPCVSIFEVDASTGKIIRVDFEAKDPERECLQPPS